MDLTTPALLFPAISLLMLAYTNRYLAIANLIRSLNKEYRETQQDKLVNQMLVLRWRLNTIKNMQFFGVVSMLFCVVTMFLIFAADFSGSRYTFGIALVSMMISLIYSMLEIRASIKALNFELSDLEEINNYKKSLRK